MCAVECGLAKVGSAQIQPLLLSRLASLVGEVASADNGEDGLDVGRSADS
jgi:hypothetical protein